MFDGQRVLIGPESGDSVLSALEKHLADGEVAPATEGRIRIGN
jgi:hypothetical protein